MQVFLYLSAEVVTVSSGHHYIAQYEVGSFFAHGFEGAVGIEALQSAALDAGIELDQIVLDPGLGFAKTTEHNWTLLAGLDQLASLGGPLLIGASRKRFLGDLLDGRTAKERDDATLALTVLLAERGVWAVRTHTVRAQRDAIAVVGRLARTVE